MDDIRVKVIMEPWFSDLAQRLTELVSELELKGMHATAGYETVAAALKAALPHAVSTRAE